MAARSKKSTADAAGEIEVAEPVIAAGPDVTAQVPESLRIDVALPEPVHHAPAEELAVTLHDHAQVDPALLESDSAATTSKVYETVELADVSHPDEVDAGAAGTTTNDEVFNRRDRLAGVVSAHPEPATMLTAERLVDSKKRRRQAPEGRWPEFVYAATLHLVNLGDSPAVQLRKALDARIAKPLAGGARFVPVLTRKGGVGKTTVTTLLGMAMADVREDRVIAVDANPDRGTLAERVNKQTRSTVRDVVTGAASLHSFNDFAALVSRDETRLDILASDTDPLLSVAFDEGDYNVVADIAGRFYSVVLTDCGTGIVHSVMRAVLQRADEIVIVSGGSVDEARLASETLTWLEANGYGGLVKNAVVALNTATHGTNLVNVDEIELHFRSRVREVIRIPYDPHIAAGSVIEYKQLHPYTREAARDLAAFVVDGLPTDRNGSA